MARWIKITFSLLVAFIIAFSLSACGNVASKDKKPLEKVRVAEVTRSVFYTPLYVALAKGYFKDEGLDIQLKTTWGGDKTMTTLLSNGADIGLVGSETSIYVYKQAATDPVINFAQLTATDGTFLVSRKKIDHFSWDQLKGSTFLGQRKGGMPQMVSEYVLKKHGIDPHKDLKLIQNVDFANIGNAFTSGTGDFVQLFEPTASIFEKEGKGHIVASFGTESGEVPYTTFMAKQSYLKSHEQAVEKFVRALYRANQWIEKTDPNTIAKTVQPYFKDTKTTILASSIERYRKQGSFSKNLILSKQGWKTIQEIMMEAGELNKPVDYNKLVNTKIVKHALK
ncbi:ABC transporter substrate-binding protein [Heyndrickxia ginsengihumi]|uniref:ABC transporter substrate-binding protein n=1 Tax=Heyndrickxia ginsengihumi TaxID=363870 RepID=UPI003D1978F8